MTLRESAPEKMKTSKEKKSATTKSGRILIFTLFLISACSFAMLGCETEEDNKMADAQECMDKLRDTDSAATAQACEDKLAGIYSAESYVIRCSVQFFKGGVTSSKLLVAFDTYNNAADNLKTAILMDALSQNTQVQAELTYRNCMQSGVASLQFIAATSLTGTLIQILGGAGNFTADLAACDAGGAGGLCEDATIGTAVITMYDIYCVGDATSESICVEIRSAKEAGNNDPAAVAIALYALLAS